MTMLPTILRDELVANVGLTIDEPTAIVAWASSWRVYFEDAIAGAVPIITAPPTALDGAEAAMAAAMVGIKTAGAVSLQAGVTAWWAAMVAAPPAFFLTATLITPPAGIAGISVALTAVFLANTVAALPKADAMLAIANALHVANAGGTATIGGTPLAIV